MDRSGTPRVNAVVLAGAPNDGKLKEVSDERWEALIPVAGKPLIRYSVDPLLAARSVDRIVVVGPVDEIKAALDGLAIDVVPPTGDMFDNVLVGWRHLTAAGEDPEKPLLVSTADIPLITPEIVDELVKVCLERGGEAFYPMATRETMEAKFPGTKRTYGTLREGTLTGGNLFVVNGAVLERVAPKAKALIAARKNPLKMAMVAGIGFAVMLVLGRLDIRRLETYVERRFGLAGRVIIVPWAEIGIDVDKPADLDLVRAYFQRSAAEKG